MLIMLFSFDLVFWFLVCGLFICFRECPRRRRLGSLTTRPAAFPQVCPKCFDFCRFSQCSEPQRLVFHRMISYN